MEFQRILINVISGLFISSLIGYVWNCFFNKMYRAPDSNKIKEDIYQNKDNTCYKLMPQPVIGPIIFRNNKEDKYIE